MLRLLQESELTAEESSDSLAKMLMLEGKLTDSLQTAADYKRKLKAEKKRLEEDHARLQEEMDGTKERCADLEAEVRQLKEKAELQLKKETGAAAKLQGVTERCAELKGSLSAAENKCSVQMSSIAALESRISELQNSTAWKSDVEPSMAPRELAEQDDPSEDLLSDTALSHLVDDVELYELRRLESLRLMGNPPVGMTAKRNLPVMEPQAVTTATSVPESALAEAEAEIANLKDELQAMRFQAAEQSKLAAVESQAVTTAASVSENALAASEAEIASLKAELQAMRVQAAEQSKLVAMDPQAVTPAAPVSENALAKAEAKITSLKAELQAMKFELRREENANAPSRSADWNRAFNPSPRDTQRLLEDAANLPREGLLAELERVCVISDRRRSLWPSYAKSSLIGESSKRAKHVPS